VSRNTLGVFRAFVCPWCSKRFVKKADLKTHWLRYPECFANRKVNSPLEK